MVENNLNANERLIELGHIIEEHSKTHLDPKGRLTAPATCHKCITLSQEYHELFWETRSGMLGLTRHLERNTNQE